MNKNIVKISKYCLLSSILIGLFISPVIAAEMKILRVGQTSDAITLDPQKFNDILTANITKQIYNSLVKVDAELKIQPDLAKSWKSTSNLEWVFYLNQGVKFHNGEELTAADVVFTIRRILNPATASPGIAHVRQIDKVEAVDKYTVKITTKIPFAPLLYSLARYEVAILNEKAVKNGGANYGQKPVGTGPFQFVEWVRGDHVTLDRFANYFEGPAKLDRVIYRGIPEDATRIIELESGGIDLIPANAPAQDYLRMKGDKRFKTYETRSQSTLYVFYNVTTPPFNNQLVRQALNYAVDSQAIIDAVYFGIGKPSVGPLSDVIFGFDPSLTKEPYAYNPEKAKALLRQAGFPNGFSCTLYSDTRSARRNVCELVQAYLQQVGVDVKIELLERGAFLSASSKGLKGMGLSGWVGTGDGDGALFSTYHGSSIGGVNYFFINIPELNKEIEMGQATLDQAKRLPHYKKAQAIINEYAPQIFLQQDYTLALSRANVDGFKPYPNQIAPLYKVDKK